MAKFYDSISECWFDMPEKSNQSPVFEIPEGIYERAARLLREAKTWEAVTATATSTQMSAPEQE